ncbi:MAG TPA: hypothetical protein EYG68_09675 [Leucothrix mucor]|nr:hypothetical protein [Leucothrix mucor]
MITIPLKKRVSGVTLIELLISTVLGLLIILGLSTLYLSSQKSAHTHDAISNMEVNARIALAGLRQTIEHTGFPSIYNVPLDKPFHSAIDGDIDISARCRGGSEKLVKPTSIKTKVTKDNGTKDWIVVKYMSDNEDDANHEIIRDCLGGKVDPKCSADPINGMYNSMNAVVYNAFYISSKKALLCAGSRSSIPQPIAENITNMQFLYGVRSSLGTSYLTATQVETNKAWENVISVQVAILASSDNEVLSQKEERHFVLLDKKITKDSKYLYRVYSTTINLPNRNRGVL